MLRWLSSMWNRLLITLRVSILTVFIALFVFSIIVVTSVTYVRFSHAIQDVSFKFMHQVSKTVFNSMVTEINDIEVAARFSANLIQRGIIHPDNSQELVDYTYDLIRMQKKTLPSVQAALWGDEAGNFILASKLDDQTIASDIIDRKKKEVREVIFKNLQGLENYQHKLYSLEYDPRVRPWYIGAKAKGDLIWTEVYAYHSGFLGITVAAPVYQNDQFIGAFAFNMRLDYLRHFIENLKVSEHGFVYIVSETGHVISFPDLQQYTANKLKYINEISPAWLKESFDYFKANRQKEFVFRYQNENYLAIYSPLPIFTPHVWYIAVVAPEKDFIYELIKTNYLILFVSFFMLVLGILLMSMLVTQIVKSIKKLVLETERIKLFNLEETPPIQSRIKEVSYLADAIATMKNGLRSFQKYVPATLVRNLIETGKDIVVGGDKKELAIFFSDIENFTETAEHMDPNELVKYLCDYFDELTRIIVKSQGTIDKYIGDSIMAFWGAPLKVRNPCVHAAHAALKCKKRLTELYTEWEVEGRKILKTRIGLHFGEVVVGNVGSSERLSYTAVGDAINISNRLEGLNKIYGTQIIVSEAFYEEVKDQFVLRKLDCVILKGKNERITLYELLAEHLSEIPFDIKTYSFIFKRAFSAYQHQKWDEAIALFKECIEIYPKDTVAPFFIKRIASLKEHLNGSRWDGVWRFEETKKPHGL